MVAAAAAAARAISYTNAGTIEFLLDSDGAFYFLEMNTRLQVEHPVTEMVTGLDLVELQIRIARGEPLAMRQEDVRFAGHAIEARLYAEAPHKGFLPQSGRLVTWRPPAGAGIRVDHGLAEGQEISAHYDPLLAKIIAHGGTREEARRRLFRAVQDTIALGLATNRGFLADCLGHEAFAGGGATTQFVPTTFANIPPPHADADAQALAAALWFEASARRQGHDPARAWASTAPIAWPLRLEASADAADVTVCVLGPRHYQISDGRHVTELQLASDSETGLARVRRDDKEEHVTYAFDGDTLHLKAGDVDLAVRETLYERRGSGEEAQGSAESNVRAPMNGKVAAILVAEGAKVVRGQRLAVVEAMKMQHELTAGSSGTVARVAVKAGDQVAARQLLVELKLAE
jgi:geranyl-CoA carboxylase alpha subunit